MGLFHSCLKNARPGIATDAATDAATAQAQDPADAIAWRDIAATSWAVTHTLRDVVVLSSHNTYIAGWQNLSVASLDAIDRALDAGFRCLELDLFRHPLDPTTAVVAHGMERRPFDLLTTTYIPFETVAARIATRAWTRTSDPLFLCLEVNMHEDPVTAAHVADVLQRYFGARLYDATVGNVEEQPLAALTDKVVIMTGGGVAPPLAPLVHLRWDGQRARNLNAAYADPADIALRDVTRIYPDGNLRGIFSLNYDTAPFLARGATFIALNAQTADAAMNATRAHFIRDGVGYRILPKAKREA